MTCDEVQKFWQKIVETDEEVVNEVLKEFFSHLDTCCKCGEQLIPEYFDEPKLTPVHWTQIHLAGMSYGAQADRLLERMNQIEAYKRWKKTVDSI